jgi:D-arabinose 1-dehydrogenase-like Zn-dependent alcohol dehydrogenase
MRSYEMQEFGGPLQLAETPNPKPQGAEVLLRIRACGVCHSDIHIWQGGYDLGGGKWLSLADRGIKLPLVMGHEPLGEVVALGPHAAGVSVGDVRLVFPWIGCGKCARCAEGQENNCLAMRTPGVLAPGGYADHLLVPHARYLLPVDGLEETSACTLACAGITAYSALKKAQPLSKGDGVVIIGAGGVGLTGVNIAKGYLDHEIIVVDLDDGALQAAKAAGAHHLVNPKNGDPVAQIQDLTGGGAGAVVDFVASPKTAPTGIAALRKGGSYVAVGLYGGEMTLSLATLPLRHVALRGSYVGNLGEMQELMDLVRDKHIPQAPVKTRPLDEAYQAVVDLSEGRVVGRQVLVP